MIELKKVSKGFGTQKIFENVDLLIKNGQSVGLTGENGCGKSVLLKLICGFSKPGSGDVFIDGERLGDKRDFIPNAGVIINAPNFIGSYTAYENLMLLAAIRKRIGKKEVVDILDRVGLSDAGRTKVRNYSLGMKQRLRIAQAVMEEPDYLILDEPMNALDKEGVYIADSLIDELHGKGATIIMTSHDPNDIKRHCERILKVESYSVSPSALPYSER